MQALMYTWTRDKNQWPCKRRGQSDLQNWRVSYRGRRWSGQKHWQWQFWGVLIGMNPSGGRNFSPREKGPTQHLQARQPTGQEHGCTYQQTDCLRSSWTHDCLLNRNHVVVLPDKGTTFNSTHQWATTSPNYQEACRSLRDSLINQLGDSRSKNYNLAACRTKVTITESQTKWNSKGICPRWWNKIKPQKNI